MRHSPTPSERRRRTDGARPRRRARPLVRLSAALVGLGIGTGCVSSGTHEAVVQERDQLAAARRDLEEKVRLLEIANESLDRQVVRLVDEREDLLQQNEKLLAELGRSRTAEEKLTTTLRSREEELAATAAALIEKTRSVGELQQTYEALVGDLESEVAAGQIRIEQLRDGIDVGLSDEILFDLGSVALSSEGRRVLVTVAERLAPLPYLVVVEGHTDSLAIRGALKQRYPTNWELAGARAATVVRLLEQHGIDGTRLTAASFGPFHPVADNSTADGRAQNRRIEIRLRPAAEPAAAAPDTNGS